MAGGMKVKKHVLLNQFIDRQKRIYFIVCAAAAVGVALQLYVCEQSFEALAASTCTGDGEWAFRRGADGASSASDPTWAEADAHPLPAPRAWPKFY